MKNNPRLGGEDKVLALFAMATWEQSPQSRGKLESLGRFRFRNRKISASTGKVLRVSKRKRKHENDPRVGGEDDVSIFLLSLSGKNPA